MSEFWTKLLTSIAKMPSQARAREQQGLAMECHQSLITLLAEVEAGVQLGVGLAVEQLVVEAVISQHPVRRQVATNLAVAVATKATLSIHRRLVSTALQITTSMPQIIQA